MTGAKVACWSCIAVGGTLSLLANLAYAYLDNKHPSNIDVFIAVIWPVLLYGALELFTRVPWQNTWVAWVFKLLAPGLVGSVALVSSYGHMHDVIAGARDHPFARIMGPIAIDGLMVSAAVGLDAIKQEVARLALLAAQAEEELRTTSAPVGTPGATTGSSGASASATTDGVPARSAGATSRRPARSRLQPTEDLVAAFRAIVEDLRQQGRAVSYRNVGPALREHGHAAGRAKVDALIAEHAKPQLQAV